MNYSQTLIPTPLGDLFAIASETHLIFLDFVDTPDREYKITKLTREPIIEWTNPLIQKTMSQLKEYFSGKRKEFDLPVEYLSWTEFQQKSWNALRKIPYGETRSYLEQSTMIGHPKAVRAIGGANHNNPIVIIIPCHRVIGASGKLVGYGGGIERKVWLLEHEKSLN